MLNAINRLDAEANQFWTNNPPIGPSLTQTGPIDGFLMREDVPPFYYDSNHNEKDFNYSMKEYGFNAGQTPATGFCGTPYIKQLGGYAWQTDPSGSKFQAFLNSPTLSKKDEMGVPTDKFHSMLTALMFVVKYIPATVTYIENGSPVSFQDNGVTSLKLEAQLIALRIYNYMKNGFSPGFNTWILHYPDFTGIPPLGNGRILNTGAFADVFSWPLTRMACNISHGFPFNFANINCILDPNGFNDATTSGIGLATYNAQGITPGASMDNAVFKAWDQAGSNMPVGPFPAASAMQGNTTFWHLQWANLARIVLHQTDKLNVEESVYSNVIAEAPCTGPFNFSPPSNNDCSKIGSCQFSAQEWLEKPSYRNSNCTACASNNSNPFLGNYPGVDYMLLHNLYYEYHNQLLFDSNLGNTGGINASGASSFGGGPLSGALYVYSYNLFANIYNGTGSTVNAITTTACNIVNSVSSFFGGSNVCTGSNIQPTSTIPTGNNVADFSNLAYIGYNLMDNYDNSVWPKQIYNGPLPPSNFGVGLNNSSNPNSPFNPNNPNSLYNPNNPNGYYANPANFTFQGILQPNKQAKVGLYQNLTSTAHIYATASPAAPFNTTPSDVRYRAGKEITLLPGFQVDAGSNFFAYVKRYLCNQDGDALEMRSTNSNDSLNQGEDNAHYETDYVNQLPLHYVEHPLSDSDLNPGTQSESQGASERNSNDDIQNIIVEQYTNASLNRNTTAQSVIMSEASKQRFVVLPNPNNGVFKIFANKVSLHEEFTIVIYDAKGLIVATYDNLTDNVDLDIDLTQLSKGIYLVNISSNAGYKNSKKVSVN